MMTPTLVASRTALPPEGAAAPAARQSRFRGPCWREEQARRKKPLTLFTAGHTLPPEGAGLAWGGPALTATAPTLATARVKTSNRAGSQTASPVR